MATQCEICGVWWASEVLLEAHFSRVHGIHQDTAAAHPIPQDRDVLSRGTEGRFWTEMLAGAGRAAKTHSGEHSDTITASAEEKAVHAELLAQLYNGDLEPDPPPVEMFKGFTRPGIAERTEAALTRLDQSHASHATSNPSEKTEATSRWHKPVLTTFAPLSSLGLGLGALEKAGGDGAVAAAAAAPEALSEEAARGIVKSHVVAELERRSQEALPRHQPFPTSSAMGAKTPTPTPTNAEPQP